MPKNAKIVALLVGIAALTVFGFAPKIRRSSVRIEPKNYQDLECSIVAPEVVSDLGKGVFCIHVRNISSKSVSIYTSGAACVYVKFPDSVRGALSMSQGDENFDPMVSENFMRTIAPNESTDIRVYVTDSFIDRHNLFTIGTYTCQVFYREDLVNSVAKDYGWHSTSNAGNLNGPTVSVTVGWINTSINL